MDEVKQLSALIGNKEAKVLLFLTKNEIGCSLDIEQATKLRQPEASVATNNLVKMQLIAKKEEKVEGKGRPRYYFSVSLDAKEILLKLVDQKEKELKVIRESVTKLF